MEVFVDGKLNAEWIKEIDKKDALFSKIRAYFLPGTQIKPGIKCCASPCKLPVRSAEFMNPATADYEYNPMMFCFTCNSTFHVHCVGLNQSTIPDEAVPWLCHACRENVQNPLADRFYKATNYKHEISVRRKHFFRESTLESKEDEFETDNEYDSCDLLSFERVRKQKDSIQTSWDENERRRLQNEILQAKAETRKAVEKSNAF